MIFSYFFQPSPDFTEKLFWMIMPPVVVAILTFLATRRRNLADTTNVWQKMYLELIEKVKDIGDKAEIVEDEFDEAKRQLKKCKDGEEGCLEFKEIVNDIFKKTEAALADLKEHAPIIDDIQVARRRGKLQSDSAK